MRSKLLYLGIAGILATHLFGCASSKTSSWSNPEFKGQSIGKTVVLALFEDDILSREFEGRFAERLLYYVPAASLRADVKDVTRLDKEAVTNLLKQNQVKTIIITHLMSAEDRSQIVPYAVPGEVYVGDYGSYYTYCTAYIMTASVDTFMEYDLETALFDVDSGKLMWSGRRNVYDFNSDVSNMNKVINGVVRQLEKEGMLK